MEQHTTQQIKEKMVKLYNDGRLDEARVLKEEIIKRRSNPPKVNATPAPKLGGTPAPQEEMDWIDRGKRVLGLGARSVMENANTMTDIATMPFRTIYSKATGRPMPMGLNQMMSQTANQMGLPKPETMPEKFSSGVTGMVTSGAPMLKAPMLAGQQLPQLQGMVAGSVAAEGANQADLPLPVQIIAGILGGVAAPMAINKAQNIYSAYRNGSINSDDVLKSLNIDTKNMTIQARSQLSRDIDSALQGGNIDQAALQRLAAYRRVGATPTQGRLSLHPSQVTREQNAAATASQQGLTGDDQLNMIANRNNQRLVDQLDDMGASRALPDWDAGTQLKGTIKGVDAAKSQQVDDAYDAFKNSAGRDVQFDAKAFYDDVIERLVKEGAIDDLPEGIKNRIDSYVSGVVDVGGIKVPISFNVDEMKTLEKMISRAKASGSSPAYAASIVRDALHDAKPLAPQSTVRTGNPTAPRLGQGISNTPVPYNPNNYDALGRESRGLLDTARQTAASRFSWQESSPAISAALDDTVAAENFVKQYIISSANRSGIDNTRVLMQTLNSNPASKNILKDSVLSHLQKKAGGQGGNFSFDNFSKSLDSIGKEKLSMLFEPDEMRMLFDIKTVAKSEMFRPKGHGVNASNSANAAAGMIIDFMRNSLVGRMATNVMNKHITPAVTTNTSKNLDPALVERYTKFNKGLLPLMIGGDAVTGGK